MSRIKPGQIVKYTPTFDPQDDGSVDYSVGFVHGMENDYYKIAHVLWFNSRFKKPRPIHIDHLTVVSDV